jgi:hypothetical protein
MLAAATIRSGSGQGAAGGMLWSQRSDGKTATITFSPERGPASYQSITGAPYSGTQSNQTIRTLANGTQITQRGLRPTTVYRDSFGRTRFENQAFPVPSGMKPTFPYTLVQIEDPVAGYFYVLDSESKIAHRVPLKVTSSGPPEALPNTEAWTRIMPDGTTLTSKSLGVQTMLGMMVAGTKTTVMHPAGSQMGNDRPVTTTDESWMSPQLGVLIYARDTNPDGSESWTTMQDFSAADPDASLFQVPAGYKLVDETGSFTIGVKATN